MWDANLLCYACAYTCIMYALTGKINIAINAFYAKCARRWEESARIRTLIWVKVIILCKRLFGVAYKSVAICVLNCILLGKYRIFGVHNAKRISYSKYKAGLKIPSTRSTMRRTIQSRNGRIFICVLSKNPFMPANVYIEWASWVNTIYVYSYILLLNAPQRE